MGLLEAVAIGGVSFPKSRLSNDLLDFWCFGTELALNGTHCKSCQKSGSQDRGLSGGTSDRVVANAGEIGWRRSSLLGLSARNAG
jgi:hypothetical protein